MYFTEQLRILVAEAGDHGLQAAESAEISHTDIE
jgi:hypothetical protein